MRSDSRSTVTSHSAPPPSPILLVAGAILGASLAAASLPGSAAAQVSQNPSPMVETTRAHERVERRELPGYRTELREPLPRPARIYVPPSVLPPGGSDEGTEGEVTATRPRLLLHFHGAAYVAEAAVHGAATPYVLVAVHLGAGSSAYDAPLRDPGTLARLVEGVVRAVRAGAPGALGGAGAEGADPFGGIDVSAFSAGYGAVRALLGNPESARRIDGILLLDGLHAGYLPPRTPLAEGGRIDTADLAPFVGFARRAARREVAMLVTHSEIFPGTFASTTETAEHLLSGVGIERTPVLRWGPVGMQQLSKAERGSFRVMGFAGNTAPDHIDHFHGMGWFLERLRGPGGSPAGRGPGIPPGG